MQNKTRVLVVDDSEINRQMLEEILSPLYEVLEADNGEAAVAMLNRYDTSISCVLLDIMMPQMDGFEVLAVMNQKDWIKSIPVIMISAETSSSYIDHAYDLGAMDYISRPFDTKVVLRRVQNTIMLYKKQQHLENLVAEQILEKERNSNQMVEVLSNIVEFRNGESGLHVLHIRVITGVLLERLARIAPQYELTPARMALISNASALHDIGKISIPEEILNKPGRLTKEEFEVMKTHAEIGARILDDMPQMNRSPLVKVGHDICRWHHERYDGRGYPDGLKGDEIPIAAQVVALADVYDALTSERVYKPAYSHEKAMKMIFNGECGIFNPLLLQCLMEAEKDLERELTVKSPRRTERMEMKRMVSEVMSHDELQISNRTLTQLEQERVKHRFYTSVVHEIMFEYDVDTDIVEFSEWGAKYLGVPEMIFHPQSSKEISVWKDAVADLKNHLKDASPTQPMVTCDCSLDFKGKPRLFKLVAYTLWESNEDEKYSGFIGKLMDIQDENVKIGELTELASRDALTGLYNQKSAEEQITAKLSQDEMKPYVMMIIDMDSFEEVNKKNGFLFGNSVLKYVAKQIQQHIREEDVAARIGGDEFLLFMEHKRNAEQLVQRISHALADTYQNFPLSVSIGAALCPEHGTSYAELFRHADEALYTVRKEEKLSFCLYSGSVPDYVPRLTPIDE